MPGRRNPGRATAGIKNSGPLGPLFVIEWSAD